MIMPGGYDPMQGMLDMIFRSPDGTGRNEGGPMPRPQMPMPQQPTVPQMQAAPQTSPSIGLDTIMQILMMLMQQRNTPGTERYNSPNNPAFANRPLP